MYEYAPRSRREHLPLSYRLRQISHQRFQNNIHKTFWARNEKDNEMQVICAVEEMKQFEAELRAARRQLYEYDV